MTISKVFPQLPEELQRVATRVFEQNSKLENQLSEASSRLKRVNAALGLEHPAVRSMQQIMRAQDALLPKNAVWDMLLREAQIREMLSPVSQAVESFRRRIAQHNEMASRIAQQLKFNERRIARALEPYQTAMVSLSGANLAKHMEALKESWVLPDCPDQSVLGFVHLSCLSEAARVEDPYSREVSELVASELGNGVESDLCDDGIDRDTAAIAAGLNPDLIAFPSSEYSEVLWGAGFKFHFIPTPTPQAIESAESAAFDPKCWRLMCEIEQRLRFIIETALNKQAGQGWVKRRVSEPVRKRWKERQDEDRANGRAVYALIQYADFMDLAEVVNRSDNWEEVFKPIFQNREDFMVSLRRLHPVRKDIAHNRPLSRCDVLTLFNEATRILNALGARILH